MNPDLEKRMYFFVPYNISPIQQAIQAGHAALEYAVQYGDTELFKDFANVWKTWIILNGGTTNSKRDDDLVSVGSLNQLADQLSLGDGISSGIDHAYFCEPDLEDALTAVCFICDERVFNYKGYPDFHEWIIEQDIFEEAEKNYSYTNLKPIPMEQLREMFPVMFPGWVRTLGGEENVFLRNLLKGKKLA